MSVFLALTTDAFADVFNQQAQSSTGRAGAPSVRRPLRGLEVKDDTYCIIKVIQADGTPLELIDSSSSSGTSVQNSNFILQSVQEARMEKHQIVETFGEPYIFFFGESPRFLDVQAILVNSNDFNWYSEFWANYNQYLRGTKMVENGARMYLFYDDIVVEGYMLQAQASKVSEQPLMAQLSFRMFLTNYSSVSFVGDPNFPTRQNTNVPPDVSLSLADEFEGGLSSGQFSSYQDMYEAAVAQAQQGIAQQVAGLGGFGSTAPSVGVGAGLGVGISAGVGVGAGSAGGFGGASSLSAALRFGLVSSGYSYFDYILYNSAPDLTTNGGDYTRTAPERGLISDNTDEFTGGTTDQVDNPQYEPDDFNEPPNFGVVAVGITASVGIGFGAGINSPNAFNRMGLGPNFSSGVGFAAVGGTGGMTASFGVGTGFASGSYGGLNGGLGFVGGLTPNPLLVPAPLSPLSVNPSAGVVFGASQSVYGNGVSIGGGLFSGVGIGGGIPGGMSTGTGPNGIPLQQFQGGTSYSSANGFGSSAGFLGGVGVGASVFVGGTPSAFSTAVFPGNYTPGVPYGSGPSVASTSFFIGPDGSSSDTNTTGLGV